MLRLGLFDNFKGFDAVVLLDADAAGINALIDAVTSAAAEPQVPVELVDLCHTSVRNSVRLYISGAESHSGQALPGYRLSVAGRRAADVQGMLRRLSIGSGHQYFDLSPPTVQLMVSSGEYGTGASFGVLCQRRAAVVALG